MATVIMENLKVNHRLRWVLDRQSMFTMAGKDSMRDNVCARSYMTVARTDG